MTLPVPIDVLQRDYYTLEITRPSGTGNAANLRKITLFLQESPLPGLALKTFQQPTPLSVGIPVPANSVQFDPLRVKFKVDKDADNWWEIFDWIADMTHMGSDCSDDPSGGGAIDYSKWHGSAVLTFANEHYKVNYKVVFENVIPIRLFEIPFTSTSNVAEDVISSAIFEYSYYHKQN